MTIKCGINGGMNPALQIFLSPAAHRRTRRFLLVDVVQSHSMPDATPADTVQYAERLLMRRSGTSGHAFICADLRYVVINNDRMVYIDQLRCVPAWIIV